MITREVDYSIRAILHLSRPGNIGQTVPVSQLAEATDIPYRFLRRIMATLVDHGFATSSRGRHGGFRLTRQPERISLLDVIRAIDPKCIALNRCLDPGETCSQVETCPVHVKLVRVQKRLDDSLQSVTFDTLHRKGRAANKPLKGPEAAIS